MGNAFSEDDSVEVTHQSGMSRVANAMCLAFCVAPLLIMAMCATVGFNEHRAVCEAKALDAGRNLAHEVGCSSASEQSGSLIFGTCDLQKAGLTAWSGDGDFSSLSHTGIGLRVEAQMLCCVEQAKSETKKDKIGGGTTTITKYTYKTEWVNSNSYSSKCQTTFHSASDARAACRVVRNPSQWPSGAPRSKTKYANQIKVGPYAVQTADMISQLTLMTPITAWSSPPANWTARTAGSFTTKSFCETPSSEIGSVQVSFYSNDWAHTSTTFAGENVMGVIGKWTAPSSWLCSGFTVGNLKEGQWTRDQLFDKLVNDSKTVTMILRLVGFLVLWLAFALCFGPCEALLDCIPCIGPMLGDCFSCAACCVACMPATVCFLGVAGAMWCIMRPLIGIPLMILWVLFMGGLLYYVYGRKDEIGKKPGVVQQGFAPGFEFPSYGTTPAQPMPRQLQVVVPPGSGPGDMVQVVTPEGVKVQAEVPPGIPPGGLFMMSY